MNGELLMKSHWRLDLIQSMQDVFVKSFFLKKRLQEERSHQPEGDHFGSTEQGLSLHRVYRRNIPNKKLIKTTPQSPYRDIAENL